MQSVLAIPFPMHPVAEAAGDVVPSTDGAFEASFAADAPRLSTTAWEVTDTAAPGFGVVPNVSLAMAPMLAGQGQDPSFEAVTAMEPGLSSGVIAVDGLPQAKVADLDALDPPAPELRAFDEVGPQEAELQSGAAAPKPEPDGRESIGPGSEPTARGATMAGDHGLTPVTPVALIVAASIVPSVAMNAEAGGPVMAGSSPASANTAILAVRVEDGKDAGVEATGLATGQMARLSEDPVPNASGASPSVSTRHEATGRSASPAKMLNETRPAENAWGTLHSGTLGQPVVVVKAGPPALEPVSMGAARDSGSIGQLVPQATEVSERRTGLTMTAYADMSGDESLTGTSIALEIRSAPSDAAQSDAGMVEIETAGPGKLPSDQPPAAATPGGMSAPTSPLPATPAGFWERLFNGLPVTLSGDHVLVETSGVAGKEGGPRSEAGSDHGADALPPALSTLPATGDRPASGLTIFARGQALHAGPADQPAPEHDETELAAFSLPLLAGTPGQSMSQPAASAPSPMQLPVPHVASQITAALSQTADGATELALSPEELGNVRLRLERDSKNPERLVVHITFERPETLDLFRRHAGELTEALRDAGYAGADIGFGREGSSAGTPERDPGHAAPDYGSGATGATDPQAAESSSPRLLAGASLDLRL